MFTPTVWPDAGQLGGGCLHLQCGLMTGKWVEGVGCLHLQCGLMLGDWVVLVLCLHLQWCLMPGHWVEIFMAVQGVRAASTSINLCLPCTSQTVLMENQPSASTEGSMALFTPSARCKQPRRKIFVSFEPGITNHSTYDTTVDD